MTELLQQLDLIAEQAHLDRRWRYSLAPGCELIVSSSKSFGSERKWEADLRGAEFSMRAEAADAFEVLIHGTAEPGQGVIAFEGGTWADGIRVRSLLDSCGNDAARSAAADFYTSAHRCKNVPSGALKLSCMLF